MLLLKEIEENKYFFGFVMIFINIGSRFIIDELTEDQKQYINTKLFRRIILFCIFFMATRDLIASITLTVIFILFISDMFNDTLHNNNSKSRREIVKDINENISQIQFKLNNLN